MNDNLLYCIIGMIGGGLISFLVSLFFYHLGFYNKCLLVDLISDGKRTDDSHDFVFIMRNIGRHVIEMSDFVKANRPELSIDNVEYYQAVSSAELNCIKPKLKQRRGRLSITFDFIKPKEQIVIVILGDKSIEKYYGMLKEGKTITYHAIMEFAKKKRIFTLPSLMLVEGFGIFLFNRCIPIVILFNIFLGFDIGLDLLYLLTFQKRKQILQWIDIVKVSRKTHC